MAGRRGRGDGSIYHDAFRGTWSAVIEISRDPRTGRRRRRKLSAATKSQAKELLAGLQAEKRTTGTVARRDITVESVVRQLLEHPPATWRSQVTIRVNRLHAERAIAALGPVRLSRLTPADVETLLYGMADRGYARKTITGTREVLATALRRAERDGQVIRNVAALAEIPASPRRKSQSMTMPQVLSLLESDLDTWWRAYVTCGITMGLRPGELLGLTWDDIDFGARVIRLRHGVDELELAGLKNEQSRRALRLPATAASSLRALKASQAASRLRGGRSYTGNGLVFAGDRGQPRRLRDVRPGFKLRCERAGIGRDWCPREMRHTWVSLLSDAGVDIEQIADAAGHVNSTITKTVYRHQISETISTAAEAMDRIFGEWSGA